MTKATNSTIDTSILIISSDKKLTDRLIGGLSKGHRKGARIESASLNELNGKAYARTARSDVVIIETMSGNDDEKEAVETLLSEREPSTVYLALVDDSVTVAQARSLCDAGIEEVLPISVTTKQLQATIDSAVMRQRALSANFSPTKGAVLSIAKARGGIGSTTVSVNLARQLVWHGNRKKSVQRKKVIVLDLDIQFGDTNTLLDFEDNGALTSIIASGVVPAVTDLQQRIQHHSSGVDLLCAPAEVVPLDAPSAELIEQLIEVLQDNYDYVVVDMPHALIDWIGPVLDHSAQVFLVTDTSVQGVRHARRLYDVFREDRLRLPVDFVINRSTAPMMRSSEVSDAESVLDTKLLHWLPDAPRETRRSADLGKPLVDLFPRAKLSKAYRRLAHSVIENITAARIS